MFVAIIRLPVYSMFRTINYRGNFIRSISTIKFCPSPEHERPAHNSTEQASHSYKLNRLILPYTFPTKNNSLNGHTVENELNPRIKFSLLPPCTGAERGERREVEEGSRELARSVQTVSTSTFADTCTPPSPPSSPRPPPPPPSSSRAFLPPSAPFPCSRERRCVSVEAEFPPLFSPLFPPHSSFPTKVPCKFCCVTTPLYTQPSLLIRLCYTRLVYTCSSPCRKRST